MSISIGVPFFVDIENQFVTSSINNFLFQKTEMHSTICTDAGF